MASEKASVLLLNLAAMVERADEALLPALYAEVSADLGVGLPALEWITFVRALVQVRWLISFSCTAPCVYCSPSCLLSFLASCFLLCNTLHPRPLIHPTDLDLCDPRSVFHTCV